MSDVSDLIAPGAVCVRLNAVTRKQVIQALCEKLARTSGLDPKVLTEAVMVRERMAGTGLGHGVALPHAQVDGLAAPVCAFARLDQPVAFDALDGQGADLVVLLLTPRQRGGVHLKALARLARFLRRADVRERLRAARGQEDLLTCFETGRAFNAA
jgi:PTS system nitrogen regulatory IIA component